MEEFFTHQDTALLLGKAVAPEAFQDDTVGRVLDRLYDTGTMKVFTACAIRADRVYGFDKRYIQFDTTSIMVYGDYLLPEGRRSPRSPFGSPMAIARTSGPPEAVCLLDPLCGSCRTPLGHTA